MRYLLKAITTNNRDLKTSILFNIEEGKGAYLFNCPDGFQRIGLSSKMKFKSVRHAFFSQINPDYFGGFPGFYLSTREAQQGDLASFRMGAYGPIGIKSALKRARSFIGSMNYIQCFEFDNMLIKDSKNHNLLQEESKTNTVENKFMNNPNFVQGSANHIFKDEFITIVPIKLESHDQRDQDAYSFIGIPKQAKGKFHPHKAKELGCDPRRHFKLLDQGDPVTLQDGTIIYPFQVREEPPPSQGFILLFIPNENYLESLLSVKTMQQFAPYFLEHIDQKEQRISIVYHSVPLQCVLTQEYQNFMKMFGPHVKHVLDCQESNDEVISRSKGYILSSRQALVCPSLIPLSPLQLKNYELEKKDLLKKALQGIDYIHSKLGLLYTLFPIHHQNFDYSQVINQSDVLSEEEQSIRKELQYLINGLFELKKNQEDFPHKQIQSMNSEFDDEPQILFLGTVSMKPTMYRAASAIMLFVQNHSILMDCAEGSYAQIWDHFQDKEKVDEVLLGLRTVFITHIHGDHQLGVIKIMHERDRLLKEYDPDNKLYIVTPSPMMEWMEQFRQENLRFPEMVVLVPSNSLNPEPNLYYQSFDDDWENQDSKMPKCPNRTLSEVNSIIENFRYEDEASEMMQFLSKTMGITQMLAIETDHCIESFGCLIESSKFGRIFYSGDTSPCQTVLNYAQNVKLLIHEATFEDALEKDAHHKKHTTTNQALTLAETCKPWRTVLTHFSPRYQKIAEITDRHLATKTMVSFDHMRIKLSYFEWVYHVLDIYRKVFSNDDILDAGYATTNQEPIKQMKKALI